VSGVTGPRHNSDVRPKSRTALRRRPVYLPGLHADEGERQRQRGARPTEVADLLAQAERNARQAPRKHHLVAGSYLARWEVAGKIRVTETSSRHTYAQAASQAARETDFYRIESPDIDPVEVPPLLFETLLSRIEGEASQAIDYLVRNGEPGLSGDDRVWLSAYLAFQITRGRAFRAEQDAAADMLFKLTTQATEASARHMLEVADIEPTPEAIATTLDMLENLQAGRLVVREQTAAIIGRGAELAEFLTPQLLYRRWLVYWASHVPFVTCDEPVVILEGPDADRRRRGGVGTADVVVFPLSPEAVLAMFHPDDDPDDVALYPQLDSRETADLNLEIAANSHRWLFERSDRTATLGMSLPPLPPATAQEGPLELVGEPNARLFNQYRPSRWYWSKEPPQLPVFRWWNQTTVLGQVGRRLLPDW